MTDQLALPTASERIRVPLNHVQRAGDDVLMRLVVGGSPSHTLWIGLTPAEARDLAERLLMAADV